MVKTPEIPEMMPGLKIETIPEKKIEAEVPAYKQKLKLSTEQKKRIVAEIIAELDKIDEERKNDNLESLWDSLQNQYEGKMERTEGMQFGLHRHTTKIKCDAVERALIQAFFDGDKVFNISARPDFDRAGGQEVLDRQESFLDYKLDEVIPLRDAAGKVFHSAVLNGTGILKIVYKTERKDSRREESWEGKPVPLVQDGQEVIDQETGLPVMENKPLEKFIETYPDALHKYPGTIEKLRLGGKINIVATYEETVYNDPWPECVDLKDFYVRVNANGIEGLRRTMLIAERKCYTYWELKKAEKDENLYDVDDLTYEKDKKDNEDGKVRLENFVNETYELMEVHYHVRIDVDDDELTHCIFHISRDRKLMVGSALYPYYGIETCYIPFFIENKKKGFYRSGLGISLRDNNIAENALLNFALEGAYLSNLITPIVPPGSEVEIQFLNKRWLHGVPLKARSGEIDFLNKYMKPVNAGELVQLVQFLRMDAGDVSGVSEMLTGRESPVDPTAPATKTLALMERSGLNIQDYVRNILPSFNQVANVLLQMYYQRNQQALKFRRKNSVDLQDEFGEISRNDMIAKTHAQSQAFSFNFHKMNEKKEDVALYSVIRQEPLVAQNPNAVYNLLKNLVKGWSPKWRNQIESILPSPEAFQQQQVMVAMQAVAGVIQQAQQQAQLSGLPPTFDPQVLWQSIQTAVSEIVTPPTEDVQKEREKMGAA